MKQQKEHKQKDKKEDIMDHPQFFSTLCENDA
jgi:hypothetical protein